MHFMETTTKAPLSEKALKNIEYAKNYPVISFDGLHQPVTVGNISTGDNGRTMINLCARTQKSGDRNAVYTVPNDWRDATAFKPGDQVCIQVVDGYIKKIRLAQVNIVGKKSSSVSAARVNDAAALEVKSAEVLSEVEESLSTAPAVLAGAESDDKPF